MSPPTDLTPDAHAVAVTGPTVETTEGEIPNATVIETGETVGGEDIRNATVVEAIADDRHSQEKITESPSGDAKPIQLDEINPGLLSLTVSEGTRMLELGIDFKTRDDDKLLAISSVPQRGILSNSMIIAGLLVVSINNVPCGTWTRTRILERLKETKTGVVLVVQDPEGSFDYKYAFAEKPTEEALLGMTFKKAPSSQLEIGSLTANGVLSTSILNAGDSVLAVNTSPCSNCSPRQAVELSKLNGKWVALLTKARDPADVLKIATSQSTAIVRRPKRSREAPVPQDPPTLSNGEVAALTAAACLCCTIS